MVNLSLIVSSASILFVIVAAFISLIYPGNPAAHQFSFAFLWWFFALSLAHWIQNRLEGIWGIHVVQDVIFFAAEAAFLIVGTVYFVKGINLATL